MSSSARTLRTQLIINIQRPAAQPNITTACDIFTYKGSALYAERNITAKAARSVTRLFVRMAVDNLLLV